MDGEGEPGKRWPEANRPAGEADTAGEQWRRGPRRGHELSNEECNPRGPRWRDFMSCPDSEFAE